MKNVKFASISDQLINTAIILDMMFNTEMIVKVLKRGKEDMTEKPKIRYMNRFIHQDKVIYDNLTEEYWNVDNNFTAQSLTNVLNDLNDELNKYKEFGDMFKSLMKKYDINSVGKLDKILFNRLDLW